MAWKKEIITLATDLGIEPERVRTIIEDVSKMPIPNKVYSNYKSAYQYNKAHKQVMNLVKKRYKDRQL